MMLCKVNLSRMGRVYRQRKCLLRRASVSSIDANDRKGRRQQRGLRPLQDEWWTEELHTEILCAIASWRAELEEAAQDNA